MGDWFPWALVGAFAIVIVLAAIYGPMDRAPAHLREPPRSELTPVDRPTLNPANKPLVSVLYGLAGALEGTPNAVKDIARTIQLHEENPVGDGMRERIARVLDEHAGIVKRGAQEVREAKT